MQLTTHLGSQAKTAKTQALRTDPQAHIHGQWQIAFASGRCTHYLDIR